MKKLDLLLTVMMCFCVILMRGQEVPFRVMFSVTEASCYNNGKIEYALTDPEGNVLESVPSVLSQVRAYYKLSESDSAHYSGWYYTGGTDTLTVNSGNYIVGVEALLADGGEYVRVDTHLLIVVGSTYQKPEVSALYLTPRRYENAGLVPSVSCLSTGRVQLRIENGRFPYTVTVCDHSTGDTLRTTVFEDRQYNGTNLNYYDYKDYYSFDSMPAGNWDFYLVDGCGYGYPRINQDVAATQLPKLENVHIYASTGNFSDSNVVNVLLELDREALLFEELMDQYVRYRLVYDGLMEGDWKKLPSLGTLVQLFDTLSDVGSYCDLMDRDITLEYRIALCEDTVFRKTFQYYRPNPLYFQKDTADIQDSIVYDPNPCLYLKHWHRHYYSIRYYSDLFSDGVYYPRRLTPGHDHIYYRYHYTHPLTWIYTDIRSGDVIKRDTVATIVNNSYLYVEDVEAHYGSVQDTVLTIPVERKLLEAKGCVLYSTLDTMTFFRCRNQIGNCWKMSHTGEDHCCEQMREVRVHAGFPTRVDPDGTIVRLVESPYNNHYNFEAVYHSNTRSWQVVRSSVENTAMISGGVDGCSLALRDYCLPSGPYTFEIITPCDSFTVSDHIDFPYIYRTQVTEEPSYEIIRECANLYLKYTKGKLFKIRYNTSPETGLPLEEESRQLTFNVDVVSGPLGGYTPRKYFVGDMIRISLPGTYVFKVYANPNEELCELPEYYDTVYFNETTVEFEYAFALLCDSSSNSGNAFVLGSNGVKPYTYTLYDHPDKQGEVLGINHTGQFMDVPMRADQELSCLVEDSCHAYFHVNFYPRALADMQKVWFDGGLTVSEACEGSTIQVHALSIGDVLQYEWSGPNQFHAISPDPFVFVPRGADEGWYKVVIHNNSCSEILIDSILLIPKASPRVTLEQDTLVCPGQPVELRFTPTSPLSDSVVTFTIAFADDEGVQFRNYAALSGVTVTDTFITNKDAMIYPLRVSDGRCDYTLTDAGDTLYVRVRTDVPHTCTIQTTYDTVCHGGNARLLARSSMEPPYTLRWYGDYDLSRLLKSDLIPDSASWSFFDTNGIVKRTLLYATVEKEGMCPPVNGLYTNVMNMHEGITVLECGQSVRMFDSGGPEGDYIPGERIVHRLVSSDGKPVSILFEEMSVSTTSHLLVISGGGLSPDSVLYDFTAGMENPGLLVSNGDTLTLFFISGEVPAAGWSAVAGQAPGVAIADVWKRDTVFLRDEVCQSTTADYDDPYGVAPMVASSEELNQAIRQAGTYNFTGILEGMGGHDCDSVVTFTLQVNPSYSEDTTVIVHDLGTAGFFWHGIYYKESGQYTYLMSTSDGCDSVEILNLVIEEPEPLPCDSAVYDTIYYVVRPDKVVNDQVTVACTNFQGVEGPGVYFQNDTLTSINECDSVVTVYLIVEEVVSDTVCDSVYLENGTWEPYTEYYEWNENPIESLEYDEHGYYVLPGQLILNGVPIDTNTYLLLTMNPIGESADELNLCLNGDAYTTDYRGQVSVTVSADGNVTASSLKPDEVEVLTGVGQGNTIILRMTTENGCDSVVTLTVNYEYVQHETLYKDTLYADEPYTVVFSNHEFTVNGPGIQTYTETLTGSNGCDSVVTLQLIVNQLTEGDTTAVACESFTWYGETYTTSGDYTQIMTDMSGRDSVVTLHLTVNHGTFGDTTAVACESYEWHGVTYTESGTYTYSFTTADGCEGVDTLHLTVHKPEHTAVSVTACDSYEWHGTTYTSGGDYTYRHEDANGCIQVDTLHLTLHSAQYAQFSETACESYEWHGETYTESGTYTYPYTTADGCEGVDTLHLTVHKPVHAAVSVTACDSYEWHGVSYTESGAYTYSYSTGDGCEGVETLHLTVHKPVHTAVSVTACDSYEWHGITYTSSGDYTYRHEDANGCTQVDTLHLTLHSAQYARFDATACESYEWHGVTYTESGTYTYSFTTADGCEGVDTLHLTVHKPVHAAVSVTACDSYEWHGTTYTSSGDYTFSHEDANGCIQVDTLHLTLHSAQYARFDATACESYEWHGVTYTESGTYTYSYTTADGCEGVDTLHLTVHKLSVNVAASDEVCGDDGRVTLDVTEGLAPIVYSLDGITSQSSNEFSGLSDGTYTIYVTDANGCEATTNVTIAPAPIVVLNITCPPTYNATLAYGDCVMEIYPEAFGTPTATIYPAEWPFEISNEVPEDNLYYEGTTTITYTMTDQVCGNAVTCEQHIVVVFPQCPDAVDCEGNVYHSVRIGCDCWTQTNLLSNCYGNPNECAESGGCEDPIPCVYEYESESFPNVEQNVDIYGRLYCAEAALDDSVINEHGHIRGICPEGWYLPTPEQYEQLYLYGGGTSIQTANGLRSPMYWLDGGGDDATGFRALPAGYYNGAAQQYERMLLDTYFWATEVVHGEVRSTAYKLTYDCNEIQRTDIHSGYGISVRCVKEKNYDVEEMN